MPGDIPRAGISINAITLIPVGITEGIVLDEKKLLTPKVASVSPGAVPMHLAAPPVVIDLKGERSSHLIENAMIHNAVNLATRHDERVGIQLIKVAMVDSCRGTAAGKTHTCVVRVSGGRPVPKCKTR